MISNKSYFTYKTYRFDCTLSLVGYVAMWPVLGLFHDVNNEKHPINEFYIG